MRYLKEFRRSAAFLEGKLMQVKLSEDGSLPLDYGQFNWEPVTQEDGVELLREANRVLGLALRFEDLPSKLHR